jgi:hypothetical protein
MSNQDNQNKERTFYDDAFYVEETPYKLWHSFDKDGKPLITSLTKELCISATRFYLKGIQEGWGENVGSSYEGVVGGKL